MTTPTRITVTANDLAAGKAADCYRCPAARAINRRLDRKLFRAHVSGDMVRIKDRYGCVVFRTLTPKVLSDLIENYDFAQWDFVNPPIRFSLDLPAHVLRRGKAI